MRSKQENPENEQEAPLQSGKRPPAMGGVLQKALLMTGLLAAACVQEEQGSLDVSSQVEKPTSKPAKEDECDTTLTLCVGEIDCTPLLLNGELVETELGRGPQSVDAAHVWAGVEFDPCIQGEVAARTVALFVMGNDGTLLAGSETPLPLGTNCDPERCTTYPITVPFHDGIDRGDVLNPLYGTPLVLCAEREGERFEAPFIGRPSQEDIDLYNDENPSH